MGAYRKKPVVIQAWQWHKNLSDAPDWFNDGIENGENEVNGIWFDFVDSFEVVKIMTLEGIMIASVGDFIIQGVKGEVYPCKPDIFEATYEKV